MSEKNHYGGTLSEEMFFPDCPHCGAAGDLHTIRARGDTSIPDWQCVACGEMFDTPEDSPWHGVGDLGDHERTAYVNVEIRGMDPADVSMTGVKTDSIRASAAGAVTKLGRREAPADD